MPFCHKCGKEVSQTTNFCSSCGASIIGNPSAPVQSTVTPRPTSSSYQQIDRTKYLVKTIIAFVLGFFFCQCPAILTAIPSLIYLIMAESNIRNYQTAEDNPYFQKANLWANITFWLVGISAVVLIAFFVFAAIAGELQ